jgi:GT2 family glycosyltransferase
VNLEQINISIVIPMFNAEKYISDCLSSVFAQTYVNYEIIVVDDGSTDTSAEIVMGVHSDKIRYFYHENKGVSASRNVGISYALNDFVAFLDADDYWCPNHLAELVYLYSSCPTATIWANKFKYSYQAPHFYDAKTLEGYRTFTLNRYLKETLDGQYLAWTSSVMIKKSLLSMTGVFDETQSHGEDLALWLRLVASGYLALGNQATAVYRLSSSSLTSRTVLNPDACMNTIDQMIQAGAFQDDETRYMLEELKNRLALAHAITAIINGRNDVASEFIRLAKSTSQFRCRRTFLSILATYCGASAGRIFKLASTISNMFKSAFV